MYEARILLDESRIGIVQLLTLILADTYTHSIHNVLFIVFYFFLKFLHPWSRTCILDLFFWDGHIHITFVSRIIFHLHWATHSDVTWIKKWIYFFIRGNLMLQYNPLKVID